MAAALECWSSRPSIDEDMVEQVLVRNGERSDIDAGDNSVLGSSKNQKFDNNSNGNNSGVKDVVQKKWQRLGKNVAGALNTLKNTLNLDTISRDGSRNECRKVVWGSVLKNLTQLYPGSQLPEKLISNVRKHFDSMPLRWVLLSSMISQIFCNFDFKLARLWIRKLQISIIAVHPLATLHMVSRLSWGTL